MPQLDFEDVIETLTRNNYIELNEDVAEADERLCERWQRGSWQHDALSSWQLDPDTLEGDPTSGLPGCLCAECFQLLPPDTGIKRKWVKIGSAPIKRRLP